MTFEKELAQLDIPGLVGPAPEPPPPVTKFGQRLGKWAQLAQVLSQNPGEDVYLEGQSAALGQTLRRYGLSYKSRNQREEIVYDDNGEPAEDEDGVVKIRKVADFWVRYDLPEEGVPVNFDQVESVGFDEDEDEDDDYVVDEDEIG